MDEECKTFFDALPVGLRLGVVGRGVAETWNGAPVERTVRTLSLPANLSGLPANADDDTQRNQELSAMVATMVATMAAKGCRVHQDVLKFTLRGRRCHYRCE